MTAADRPAAPLLFGKRKPVAPATLLQYSGTDTERDIKG
jgi:hypothetical protein